MRVRLPLLQPDCSREKLLDKIVETKYTGNTLWIEKEF